MSYFALAFRFSAKIKLGFRICSSMGFGVFPLSLRKICTSTTSTAYTSSLILLALSAFDRSLFRFCGFLLLFARFFGLLYSPMLPSLKFAGWSCLYALVTVIHPDWLIRSNFQLRVSDNLPTDSHQNSCISKSKNENSYFKNPSGHVL